MLFAWPAPFLLLLLWPQFSGSLTIWRHLSDSGKSWMKKSSPKAGLQAAHRLVACILISFTHDCSLSRCVCYLSSVSSYQLCRGYLLSCACCSIKPVPVSELHDLFSLVLPSNCLRGSRFLKERISCCQLNFVKQVTYHWWTILSCQEPIFHPMNSESWWFTKQWPQPLCGGPAITRLGIHSEEDMKRVRNDWLPR